MLDENNFFSQPTPLNGEHVRARGESRDFSWLDRSLYLCVAEKTKGSVEIT